MSGYEIRYNPETGRYDIYFHYSNGNVSGVDAGFRSIEAAEQHLDFNE